MDGANTSPKSPDDDLRALAEAATPGPWHRMRGRELVRAIRGDLAVPLFEALEPYADPLLETPTCRVGKEVVFRANSKDARYSAAQKQSAANAAFIAAFNPQTAIALLNERDALRERLAEAERERDAQYDENVNRIAAEGAAVLRAETAEAALASQKARGDRLEKLLKCADSVIPRSPGFRGLHDNIRTALAQSERTP